MATLFYINYTKDVQTLDETLFSQMRICSFDLKCEQFTLNFIPHGEEKFYTLYKDKRGLSSYYPIPDSQKFVMLLNFSDTQYTYELKILKSESLWKFSAIVGVIFLLSVLFSIYALYPLRNALLLTQEFIKDILHDFNTPLASLRLNSSMLKEEIGENQKIERIEQSVKNILSLQEHLNSYLHNHTLQKEKFELKDLLNEHRVMLEKNYPNIKFEIDIDSTKLHTNKKAFTRIIDNLLSNAAKYNKPKGFINIVYENKKLKIIDTGKGIKNPKKIFNRFYKEQERGIGIGLHIVKKLCEELGIKISVESVLNEGTTFTLNVQKLTLDK
ncbi:MAG: HAMP domain-containing sensor histidine kinase [Sulfurimonadaceae bacterium]|jgi:signal transduction histidine kinase|nr:HAMP domain-containing sensor histidine kinase [Sulfurimonadaceae bacterium]